MDICEAAGMVNGTSAFFICISVGALGYLCGRVHEWAESQ